MRILIGVDGSRAAGVACEFVERRTWPLGTRVGLMGVVEPLVDRVGLAPPSGRKPASDNVALELVLEERADALRRHGLGVETSVEFGNAADVLIGRATQSFTDLIVVGSRDLGPIARIVLGSVSTHLADHARCPVLVVRSPEATRMLLATDGTRSSLGIPRVLAAWDNAFRGLPVEVLSVAPRNAFVTPWSSTGDEEGAQPDGLSFHEGVAHEVADEMMELGWHAAAVARAGDPARQIVSTGVEWRADLIVTGSRGVGTLRRMVEGSVAHDVLLHARASVLVVRGLVRLTSGGRRRRSAESRRPDRGRRGVRPESVTPPPGVGRRPSRLTNSWGSTRQAEPFAMGGARVLLPTDRLRNARQANGTPSWLADGLHGTGNRDRRHWGGRVRGRTIECRNVRRREVYQVLNVPRTPQSIGDPAISLDDASGLMAGLGFVDFRTPPGDAVPESCLTLMIRSKPTRRHFDPEVVTYWVHHGRAGHLEIVDLHTPPPVFERISWGKIQLADRFGITNSFVTFGGFLYSERMDPDALLLVFRSSAPILRLAGHSQKRDVIADEILSFFARVVPHLWSPGEEQLINSRTPEELYAAFLVHVRHRLDGSAALREAMSGDVHMVDSELAIMAAHRPTGLAAGERLLRELHLAG